MQRVSQLNGIENAMKFVTGLSTGPLGFKSVQPNINLVLFRYGKFDRLVKPGFRWMPLCENTKKVFIGPQTTKLSNIKLLDKLGNPIIVSSILKYHIKDPVNYCIKDSYDNLLPEYLETTMRNICKKYPFFSET
jgi:regulator of protease activity HflC (stomatin/prohibitin superfamily)